MSDPNQLVLHEEARIIPIDEVAKSIRDRLPLTETVSHVLSRRGTRNGSMVLDNQGAKLVKLLADGCLLTDALKKLAVESSMAPEAVAQQAYPLIRALLSRNYLKKKGEEKEPQAKDVAAPRFRTNELFEGHTILRRVQFLEDTEIYKVRLKQGGVGALKLLRKGPSYVHEGFKRESLLLQRLDGRVTPKVVECELDGDNKYFIMEWIEGVQSQLWASRISHLSRRERFAETQYLCIEIVRAYQHLHQQGVLHSDIYPKNVLVCRDGTVRLVDFGYSFHDEVNAIVGKSSRICNPYFKSPDLAQHELGGRNGPAPAASVSSDIYSIGGLLYYLVTGSMYLDFPLQFSAVYRQICESPMVPFAQRGLHGFDKLERIIGKMLAKSPEERYASLEECLQDLVGIKEEPALLPSEVRAPSRADAPTLHQFAATDAPSPFEAPSASVNFGGAGVAYALLRAAHALEDRSLVASADLWSLHARRWIEGSAEGSLNEALGITAETVGPYSSLHRVQGVALVQALVAHSRLDSVALRGACLSFLTGVHKTAAPLEFICGRAGMLNTIQQLSHLVVENEPFIAIGNELVADMMNEISCFATLEQSPVQFVGFAHGWAGILYSLLAWGRKYDQGLFEKVIPLLEKIADMRVVSRLGSFWPYRFDRPIEEGDSSGWCNGSAGFLLLWNEAYIATGQSRWLNLARETARHCMTHFESLNSVCCGLAGRAYALAVFGATSGEQEWLDAAHRCLLRNSAGTPDVAKYPHSLFKGVLGHELAKLEVAKTEGIVFPMLASDMYGEPLLVGPLV